jgi:putative ABC transport system substrate-binding protein
MFVRLTAALVLATGCLGSEAQPRIGFVSTGAPGTGMEAFRQGLKQAGYVEGRDVLIEARFASGRQDLVPELVSGLLRQKVDVLVVVSTSTALAAKNATSTVPIVFASVFDPVAAGIVPSLAHPRGNITGSAMGVGGDFGGKWVELLKEAVPGMSRAAVLWNSKNESSAQSAQSIQAAARTLNVKLDLLDARDEASLNDALRAVAASRAEGLIIAPDPFFNANRTKIVRFASTRRLPAVYFFRSFADAGGLMAYGANNADSIRSAAKYVDKILKGARPADLPVDQPTRFELVINLKTANALGVKIPRSLLVRADEVIE